MSIKIFSYFTPSHSQLFHKLFAPSIPDDFILCSKRGSQKGPATFAQHGWGKSTRPKVMFYKEGMRLCKDEDIAIFSDVDIIFLDLSDNYVRSALENVDLAAYPGTGGLCSGFMIARINDATRKLISNMADSHRFYRNAGLTDQMALNYFKNQVRWCALPDRHFWCFMNQEGLKNHDWQKQDTRLLSKLDEAIPKSIKVFHASYCHSPENKYALMELILHKHRKTKHPVLHI